MSTEPANAIRTRDRVSRALEAGLPVVALESTVIAHGLPRPLNLEIARGCEEAVSAEAAVPATIGIVAGQPTIGLDETELNTFASGLAPDGSTIHKVSLSNLAGVMLRGDWGATTVGATLQIARAAGLRVFATGGIGGVHRGAADSFDISADLVALARYPLICVSAGAKAILDLPKTIESLETLGVPVVGMNTDEFPAFYSRTSGLPVDITVSSAEEAANVALRHWRAGGQTAVLVCVPAPEEFALDAGEVQRVTEHAVLLAGRTGVRGKAVTPFLLAELERLTGGATLKANRALLINNARVAAGIASSLSGVSC